MPTKRSLVAATFCLAMCSAPANATSLTLKPPLGIKVGQAVQVELPLNSVGDSPFLVLVSHEGQAIESVRPRLRKQDATKTEDGYLLRIPIVAVAGGVGILRATLLSYQCDAKQCTEVRREGSVKVMVTP